MKYLLTFKMKVGIIRYPGSNCDNDMLRYFNNAFYIWHKDNILEKSIDLLVIPGGFAFGDRYYKNATSDYVISPGKMATSSPVTDIIYKCIECHIPVLGVCNGFQILTKLGLLPGSLQLNNDSKFTCQNVKCKAEGLLSKFVESEWSLQVANSYGKYCLDIIQVEQLKKNNQILITYDDINYNNGSVENIAGICSVDHKIIGMMPHPERNFDKFFMNFLKSIIRENEQQELFSKNIESLMKSEHISYKSTRKYLKKLYTEGEHVIQGPGENAGIIDIGDGYCIALRIESHNHPIFIDPYQGAATGVGGILRDIFTMGARPIGIFDFLRFGTDSNNDKLLDKTIEGISDYGNCFGVANLGGNLYRSEMYNKNPLLNVGCIGIVKKENIIYGNALDEKRYLIYVGSKTGNDGVNGACMASNEFTSNINIEDMKKNIQTGDPFLERLLLEACMELSEMQIIEGMQDMGAGGLLCSSLELIQRGREKTKKNLGCTMFVDKIPTKYEMSACDRIISESQERMLLVVKEEYVEKINKVFKKWDLESEIVGKTNLSGKYSIKNSKNITLYEENIDNFTDYNEEWPENSIKLNNSVLTKIHDQKLWKQYDTTIGCRTLKGPQENGAYSLIDIYENNKKLLVTWGKDISECLNYVSLKSAKPLAVVNCLNFGNPQDTMGDFANIVKNLTEDCKKYKIPVVGGNVSLYNATDSNSIEPTPILMMISLI